jgi:hypothetical protein
MRKEGRVNLMVIGVRWLPPTLQKAPPNINERF